MKKFKGKYARVEEGKKKNGFTQKSFRKTGKKIEQYDPDTIFFPKYKKSKGTFY